MTKRNIGSDARAVLEQLATTDERTTLSVGGHDLPVTSLDKLLWPGLGRRRGATKRDLLRYLTRVSPYLLPHLADRPIFVTRFPDGVTGKSFFQKHWEPAPPFARTVDIHSAHNERDGAYLICENLATLLYLGQMAGLELHAWFSRTPRPRSSARSSTIPTSSSSTWTPTSIRGAKAGAGSRSCTAARSPARAGWRFGSGRSSRAWASSPSSRPRAARASTSTCRSAATSTSTPRARWRGRSPATCSRSGRRT
ncbi:MAG: hypothetical protein E6J17_10690 [Chloroflexi bacterium]|nr:MAG: hypothetical protein E6J17_10690 [Chloroflexota bacterium]